MKVKLHIGQLQRINWNDLEMLKNEVSGVVKVYESSFQKNLPCIFSIFLEGTALDLLHGGRAVRDRKSTRLNSSHRP